MRLRTAHWMAPLVCALALGTASPLAGQSTPAAPAPPRQLPADSLAIARRFAGWFWSSQIDSIMAHAPAADRTPANRQQLADAVSQFSARAGTEALVLEERWIRRNGRRQYWRVARFTDYTDEALVLRIVISPEGEWTGLGFGPLSQVPAVDPEP